MVSPVSSIIYSSIEEQELESEVNLEDWRNALYHGGVAELRTNLIPERVNVPILPGSDSNLPLIVAAGRGRDFVEILLDAGADVNATNAFCGTALQHAAAEGDFDSAGILLQYGADPNAKGGSRGTALIAAVRRRKFELSELLLNHGADPNQLDGYRFSSPLSVATDREMIGLLLAYGADPNRKGRDAPVLIKAIERSDLAAINLLLEHRADPNIKHKGQNALALAVERDYYKIIETLLTWGATVDSP